MTGPERLFRELSGGSDILPPDAFSDERILDLIARKKAGDPKLRGIVLVTDARRALVLVNRSLIQSQFGRLRRRMGAVDLRALVPVLAGASPLTSVSTGEWVETATHPEALHAHAEHRIAVSMSTAATLHAGALVAMGHPVEQVRQLGHEAWDEAIDRLVSDISPTSQVA